MKHIQFVVTALLFAGTSWAQQQQVSQMVSVSATVDHVDLNKRELTLRGPDGNPFIVQVPESVQRLDNVKMGDQVSIDYYQSAALSLKKPEAGAVTGAQARTTVQKAPGALPGGVVGQQISATAKVNKVDASKGQLMIKAPDGQIDTINVKDPQMRADLKNLKPGDDIQVTYSEAMAVSMTPRTTPKKSGGN